MAKYAGPQVTPEEAGIEFDITYSPEDGVLVIHIDTPDLVEDANGPILRVYLNDGDAIYENPPYPGPSDADESETISGS